jgi:Fe-S-cluster containining protein
VDEGERRLRELLWAVQDRLETQEQRTESLERSVEGLRKGVELLVQLLAQKGTLDEGHQRLAGKVLARPLPLPERPRAAVHLAVYEDKYQVANSDVDCLARLSVCFGRCCTLNHALSTQDLDDGIKFEVERPYWIRHEADRYCTHYDRERGGCGTYLTRPAACRAYTCKDDPRIWIDFEKRIAQPLPEGFIIPGAHRPR